MSDFTVVTGLSGSSSSSAGQEEAEETEEAEDTFREEKPEEAVEVERRLGDSRGLQEEETDCDY